MTEVVEQEVSAMTAAAESAAIRFIVFIFITTPGEREFALAGWEFSVYSNLVLPD